MAEIAPTGVIGNNWSKELYQENVPLTISGLLRSSANHIMQIIFPDAKKHEEPLVSKRYWLHLMELAIWLHAAVADFETKLTLDKQFLQYCMDTKNVSTVLPPRFGLGLFSQATAQDLHALYKNIEASPDAGWIFAITQTTPSMRQALKVGLLGLLSSSMVMEQYVASQELQKLCADRSKARLLQELFAMEQKRQSEVTKRKAIFGTDPLAHDHPLAVDDWFLPQRYNEQDLLRKLGYFEE
jgi:hypothetical protein